MGGHSKKSRAMREEAGLLPKCSLRFLTRNVRVWGEVSGLPENLKTLSGTPACTGVRLLGDLRRHKAEA